METQTRQEIIESAVADLRTHFGLAEGAVITASQADCIYGLVAQYVSVANTNVLPGTEGVRQTSLDNSEMAREALDILQGTAPA